MIVFVSVPRGVHCSLQEHILKQESRAIAGRTARCYCKFR